MRCSERHLHQGGLRVRLIIKMNQALLIKRTTRFLNENGTLWRRVIRAKFGRMERDSYPRSVLRSHGIGVWKQICMGRTFFKKSIRWRVGNDGKLVFGRIHGLVRKHLKINFRSYIRSPSIKLPR